MTVDLVSWLKDALDEDERAAEACINEVGAHRVGEMYSDGSGTADYDAFPSYPWGSDDAELAYMAGPGHPARVLAEVAAKRALLVEIMSWQHDYIAEDSWYSCAQSVDSQTGAPGSGCGDDARAGTGCDCGLEHRRARILGPLAQVYRDRPGFDPSWLD